VWDFVLVQKGSNAKKRFPLVRFVSFGTGDFVKYAGGGNKIPGPNLQGGGCP
jgi:hypothetical protein